MSTTPTLPRLRDTTRARGGAASGGVRGETTTHVPHGNGAHAHEEMDEGEEEDEWHDVDREARLKYRSMRALDLAELAKKRGVTRKRLPKYLMIELLIKDDRARAEAAVVAAQEDDSVVNLVEPPQPWQTPPSARKATVPLSRTPVKPEVLSSQSMPALSTAAANDDDEDDDIDAPTSPSMPTLAARADPAAGPALSADIDLIVLWRAPLRTLFYFSMWVVHHSRVFALWLFERVVTVLALSFAAVCLAYFYQLESNQQIIDPIERLAIWYGGWVFLGFLSSFGVGTGVHTFLLYLGPFIAASVLQSEKCGVNFDSTVSFPMHSGHWAFRCDGGSEARAASMWEIVGKVRWEAFAWGFGTALGELPPFFFARAARLAGQQLNDHDDLEQLAKEAALHGLASLSLAQRAKVVCYRIMRHTGFVGIMLLASVPNPLFDLAGIFAGYMLIPFWIFFGATALGKAVNKVTLQTLFVVALFHGGESALVNHGGRLAGLYLPGWLAGPANEYLAAQRRRYMDPESVPSEMGPMTLVFNGVLVFALVACLVSIVNSLAQAEAQARSDAVNRRDR